jgi:hypothetical protein
LHSLPFLVELYLTIPLLGNTPYSPDPYSQSRESASLACGHGFALSRNDARPNSLRSESGFICLRLAPALLACVLLQPLIAV